MKEEIVDALGVAIMVNAGATMVYSPRTIDAYDTKTAEKNDEMRTSCNGSAPGCLRHDQEISDADRQVRAL